MILNSASINKSTFLNPPSLKFSFELIFSFLHTLTLLCHLKMFHQCHRHHPHNLHYMSELFSLIWKELRKSRCKWYLEGYWIRIFYQWTYTNVFLCMRERNCLKLLFNFIERYQVSLYEIPDIVCFSIVYINCKKLFYFRRYSRSQLCRVNNLNSTGKCLLLKTGFSS